MPIETLLARIEAFCATQTMSASTFGKKAVNDGKLVDRLRAGKTITLVTLHKVDEFMANVEAQHRVLPSSNAIVREDGAAATSRHVNSAPVSSHEIAQ